MKNQAGFTLIELLLAMSLAAILLGLTSFNLLGAQRSASLATAEESFIADLKSQQIKAMNGINGTSGTTSFGIHFSSPADSTYTLFQGPNSASPISTSLVTADSNISFACTSGCNATNDIIFSSVSGEVLGYLPATPPIITVKNSADNSYKQIKLNAYGVIIGD